MNNDIKVTNGVSKTFEPFVILEFHGKKSVLTPSEAIQHSLTILENAGNVVMNAFLVEYFTINLGMQPDQLKVIMNDFKHFRQRKQHEATTDSPLSNEPPGANR